MKMHRYTQEEFDALPVVNGVKQCPTGDYSSIKRFGRCSFGKGCVLGEGCSFCAECSFDEGCSLGKECVLGEECILGEGCILGGWSSFGEGCGFGEGCRFGERCSFGAWCSFESGHLPNDPGRPYFAVDRIGSEQRKTYFFNFADVGMYVRAGCFGGTKAEFLEKLHADNDPVKTRHYEAALSLAEMILEGE
jgi:NDP-sugar pyrophosphorylase family protein